MKKLLYGAAVQGIQSFIFQTNELKDIVGASELVNNICSDLFQPFAKNGESIVRSAGNIKFLFDNEDDCRKAVRNFPKEVLTKAPGITVSQSVIFYDEEKDDFGAAIENLEKRLHIQRNRPMQSLTIGNMGMERSRKTGLPAVKRENNEFLDLATIKKRNVTAKGSQYVTKKLSEMAFGCDLSIDSIALDIDKITDNNDWIAIVHADGNGLGKVVQNIGKNKDAFKAFSKYLNEATKNAANKAFDDVKCYFSMEEGIIPVRPIVLGGDDFTFICRADFALDYVKSYLKNFEYETTKLFESKVIPQCNNNDTKDILKNGLTACAGIAFVKSSFPFYYGYDLAENLCSKAKKISHREKSCLMFYKVQDSFVEDLSSMTKRELLIQDNVGKINGSFSFGPYFLKENKNYWTIDTLIDSSKKLIGKEGNAIKSGLRKWMSLMLENENFAKQHLSRMKSICPQYLKTLVEDVTDTKYKRNYGVADSYKEVNYYPVYDMLAINTLKNQQTKNK